MFFAPDGFIQNNLNNFHDFLKEINKAQDSMRKQNISNLRFEISDLILAPRSTCSRL